MQAIPSKLHSARLLSFMLGGVLTLQPWLMAQEKKPADFARDVQPIFQARCILCHGSEVQMGGLRLDQRQSLFIGGKSRQLSQGRAQRVCWFATSLDSIQRR